MPGFAYTVPIGEDLTFPNSSYPFEYTFLFIGTMTTNTRVVVTDPTAGVILNQVYGYTNIYLTNINAGTTIAASDAGSGVGRPIQCFIMTSQNGVYDSQFYSLTPEEYLGTEYVIEAPTQQFPPDEPPYSNTIRTNAPYIYAFYDNTTVTIATNGGSTTIVLTNMGDVYRAVMPLMPYGTTKGFYGMQITADKKVWVLISCDDGQSDLDWGYTALDNATWTTITSHPLLRPTRATSRRSMTTH